MKIGIYTQPLRYNYGGLLQAWALQTVLRRMGHEVVTFDPNPYYRLPWKVKPMVYMKRLVRLALGKYCIVRLEEKNSREHDIKIKYLKPFIEKYINRKEIKNICDYCPDDFDAIIVGSDQVWRPMFNCTEGRTLENSFLDFTEKWNVLRIAYAASFGTDKWEYNRKQTKKCSILAKRFSAISVREISGINLCETFLGVRAIQVLDPTMLLHRDDYEKLIKNGNNITEPKGDLLCYVLDETEETSFLIKRIARERNLIPFQANSKVEDCHADIDKRIQKPVEQWLNNFKAAKFVITDSFHACVFSIIFGKPFIVIANPKRGTARYESLLSLFSLKNHLIFSPDEYNMKSNYEIDEVVFKKLNDLRQLSFQFLTESLKQTNS